MKLGRSLFFVCFWYLLCKYFLLHKKHKLKGRRVCIDKGKKHLGLLSQKCILQSTDVVTGKKHQICSFNFRNFGIEKGWEEYGYSELKTQAHISPDASPWWSRWWDHGRLRGNYLELLEWRGRQKDDVSKSRMLEKFSWLLKPITVILVESFLMLSYCALFSHPFPILYFFFLYSNM